MLFYVATIYYPGGSQFNHYAQAYSWEHNYWCNLLYKNALNGEPNKARLIALFAMICLNSSVAGFWLLFPTLTKLGFSKKLLIQFSGILSMLIASFISSKLHDSLILLASLFGLVALVGTLYVLLKLHWIVVFYFGLLNLFLLALNFLFYFNDTLIYFLPILQKVTFITFLSWFSIMSYKMYDRK